jgi:hypothetical protein
MSEESKKIEEIEKDAKQDVKEVMPTELSEQQLDDVAGGRAIGASGVGKIESAAATTTNRSIKQNGIGN